MITCVNNFCNTMANNYTNNDTIMGYITNVSNENKKKKYFVKFTMLAENDQIIDGWVFNGVGGILSTPVGIALHNSLKNKTGVKLWGSLENNNGTSTFRMQSWSKHQIVNLNFYLQTPVNNITSIKNALQGNDLNTIRVSVIDIRPSESYTVQGIPRTSTFVLIGDATTTCYLFIVTPNVDDVARTINMNLNDTKTITTTINEVGEIRRLYNCSTCLGDLNQVQNAAALLHCEKCHRHILKSNLVLHISTTIVLKNGEEKIILAVNDQVFHQLLEIIGININMVDTDIIIGMMSNGNLIFEYSELRKELAAIRRSN
ncbi:unnamed protein product [Rotaria socialis]|uniref:Uncharacterized protein n=2 Tax=Rotaria socialis TaxID=392032 RepID=A0A820UWH9_9BILA|nr:unnamed protein product [Rotaria socialis]